MPTINEINNKYDRLLVIEEDPTKTSNGGVRWKCKCDCGNTTIVIGSHLRRKKTKSCGCINAIRILLGERYEKLTVIEQTIDSNGQRAWECRCDCGGTIVTSGPSLRKGGKRDCGCVRLQRAFNQLLIDYKSEAKRRGYEWGLLQ